MSLSLRKPVEADWDRQKGTIRRLFLHQQCTIEELVERVKRNGIIVSKAQMEYKLKQWRFRRNVDKKAWNCIRHRITKRERSGKKSEVILSGVRLKPETILRGTMRNRPLPMLGKARPSSSPEPEFDLPLRICTPPPILIESSWPESLPWIRFKTQLYEAPIVQPFFKYNLENSIDRFTNDLLHSQSTHHSPTGRDVPDCQQFASNWAWSCFNMPESYPSEHVARAEILENGSSFEKLGWMFEIFIAKISNNMLDWDMVESNWPLLKAVFKHPVGSIMDRRLMESQTIKSFSDNLYRMAILAGTRDQMGNVTEKPNVDIVHQTMIWLFKGGYQPDRLRLDYRFETVTSLQYAVIYGDRVHETVKLLVEYGADMNLTMPLFEFSALQLVLDGAAMEEVRGRNVEVSRLCETFIEKVFKSTSMNQQESNIMLQYALRHGNKTMLEQLVSRGADLTFCQRTQHSPVSRVTAITCATEFIDTSRGESWSHWLECVVCLMTPHSQDFFRARPPQFFVDPLIAAAKAGNDDAIEQLLALGGNVDLENEDGIYPLLAAIAKGRYHTCKLLINSGSDVNHLGPSGLCPLHVAIMAGESDILKLLVDSAADIKRTIDMKRGPGLCRGILYRFGLRVVNSYQYTDLNPLDIAPLAMPHLTGAKRHGIGGCIQYLLNNGVFWSPGNFPPIQLILDDNSLWNILLKIDGTLSDRDQRTYDRMMEELIKQAMEDKKRNVLAKFHRKRSGPNGDEVGAALAEADIDKAVALLKTSGNLYERSSWDESFLDVALQSQDGSTIRWALAADSQYYDPGALLAAVEMELEPGIAPRQVNVPYYRVILNRRPESQEAHIWETTAVGKAAKWNNIELLRDLLAAIPPSKYCLLEREKYTPNYSIAELHHTRTLLQPYAYEHICASPLAWAVGLDKDDIYNIMVKRGYQPDNLTLYIAMAKGNLELAKSIISAGSGDLVTRKYRSGERNRKLGPVITTLTPIQAAATWNRTDIVRWLIDHGADVNDWNVPRLNKYRGPQSPLQAAVRHGNVEMLQLLLQAGVRPNDKPYGSGGLTALQEAAEMGEIGIAKLLLDHEPPADVNAHRAPDMGTTALEAAARHGRLDMVQLLLCRGAKTEGTGHRQYIRAVAMAQYQGHIEVVSLLRAHRPWTIMDQDRLVNEDAASLFTGEVHESECSDSECDFLRDWSGTESAGDSDKDSDKDGDTGEDNRQGDEGADERGGEERINDEDMSCAEYMIDECSWEDWNLEHTSDMGGMTQEEFESEVALWDPVNACFK
ncbi:hypothetical protein SCAR479_13233 [Seiridium cardinale]|uniref:Clr5 domain-containing protein n=1 Tax=Seiridium cardinale TaxID=138064 RepID=A0ABR2X8P2_9PEZI